MDKMLVLIKPEEYDDILTFLADNNFYYASGNIPGTGESILEKVHNKELSTVYALDIENKIITYFPLEIYQPDSPTRDDTKFEYYAKQLISCDDVKNKIKEEK